MAFEESAEWTGEYSLQAPVNLPAAAAPAESNHLASDSGAGHAEGDMRDGAAGKDVQGSGKKSEGERKGHGEDKGEGEREAAPRFSFITGQLSAPTVAHRHRGTRPTPPVQHGSSDSEEEAAASSSALVALSASNQLASLALNGLSEGKEGGGWAGKGQTGGYAAASSLSSGGASQAASGTEFLLSCRQYQGLPAPWFMKVQGGQQQQQQQQVLVQGGGGAPQGALLSDSVGDDHNRGIGNGAGLDLVRSGGLEVVAAGEEQVQWQNYSSRKEASMVMEGRIGRAAVYEAEKTDL